MWGIHGWWDKNLKKTIEMVDRSPFQMELTIEQT
jgi:hypothetical protein